MRVSLMITRTPIKRRTILAMDPRRRSMGAEQNHLFKGLATIGNRYILQYGTMDLVDLAWIGILPGSLCNTKGDLMHRYIKTVGMEETC